MRALHLVAAAIPIVSIPFACQAEDGLAVRPTVLMNRWAEDWSVLADPALRTEPLDRLKYIPLDASDLKSYVSLGASLRERFEYLDAQRFGVAGTSSDSWVIQRFEAHADFHFDREWQAFVQFEDARAFGKRRPLAPVDANKVDLRLAFLEFQTLVGENVLKTRIGRQDFAFDIQRFVSSRDGPNVRQSFDAIWADYETGAWRFIGFVSQPVQYDNARAFDDDSSRRMRFHTARIERKIDDGNELSAYYARYEVDGARYLDASGNERRNVFDVRHAGRAGFWDWDLEGMYQTGSVSAIPVRAWAIGARAGYTFANIAMLPRAGLQVDVASGDRHPGDKRLETFNPLFPNGYYVTLAGFTGLTNLVQVKPSVTVRPESNLTVLASLGLQWRQTTADAVYTQPNVPVPGTAGKGGRRTGTYGQLRCDWVVNRNLTTALEAVRFQADDAIKQSGGHDSSYAGIEAKFSW